jgi:transposase
MSEQSLIEKEVQAQLSRALVDAESLRKQLLDARLEIRLLRSKLDALARRIFGKKSEQLSDEQMQLLLQEAKTPGPALGNESDPQASETQPLGSETKKRRRVDRGPRVPEHLPLIEEVIVPEAVKNEPALWRRIGEEVSEQIDFEPARFLRRRVVRPKYVHRTEVDAVPVVAPMPCVLQERCTAAPGLLAQILVAKYADHLPLYRQESIYWSRHQVWLPRQSMVRWVEMAADRLEPICKEIRREVFSKGYVQVDETPVKYLDPGYGKARQGYLWTTHRPGGDTVYHWETTRAAACLRRVIPAEFNGIMQTDGYEAYPCYAKTKPAQIRLAGCWAHARRGFFEARNENPKLAGFILLQIRNLYAIEDRLRRQRAGPRLREARRLAESIPILHRLRRVFLALRNRRQMLPKSNFGKALAYALERWAELELYASEGRVEIDNNPCERAIRPTAVGKKNWLFIGEANAGHRSAVIYTLIESCRRRGLDPFAYLKDVLTRLPKATNWNIGELTPAAWAAAQKRVAACAA